jgi:hypothetical protein
LAHDQETEVRLLYFASGAVAQSGERLVRNQEVGGSIPLCSIVARAVWDGGSLQNCTCGVRFPGEPFGLVAQLGERLVCN